MNGQSCPKLGGLRASCGCACRTDRKPAHAVALGFLLVAAVAGVPASAQTVDLTHPTIAGGGGVKASGPFRVYFTIGEPVAGPVSQAEFRLVGGLQATFLSRPQGLDGPIFRDGFEDLSPLQAADSNKRSGS